MDMLDLATIGTGINVVLLILLNYRLRPKAGPKLAKEKVDYIRFVLKEFSKGCADCGPRSVNPTVPAGSCYECTEGAVSAIITKVCPELKEEFNAQRRAENDAANRESIARSTGRS